MFDVDSRTQNVLSLCTGAGGLDRGVSMALGNARVVCCVEHEASAAEVLATRMEEGWLDDAPIWTNLFTFDGRAWRGRVQGVIAGIPCQPHSVAGKGLGADDPRDLWPRTAELLRDIEPEWFFLENVPGILRYYHDCIRPGLQGMGYRVKEGLFTASEVGAPHRRERLFVLADAEHTIRWAEHEEHGDTYGGYRPGRRGGTLDDADLTRLEGWHEPIGERADERVTRAAIGTFPPGPGDRDAWQRILRERPDLAPAIEPPVRGVATGVASGMDLPRAARLRLTGNGVVPQCAALAFRTLWGQLANTGHDEHEGRHDED